MKILIVGIGAVATLALATTNAATASAATPSWLHIHTATKATAYNNSTARITPSATVSGQRAITSKTVTAYRNGKRYRAGSSVQLPAGRYATVTSGTYKNYTLVSSRRTRGVLHEGDLVQATCVVNQATDAGFGDGTTDSLATCRHSYYPTQSATDEEFANYHVGDSYLEEEFFHDEYVNQAYYVQVRHYGATHHFTSTKRALTVTNGGWRRYFSGSGNRETATFTPPHNPWRISYSYHCSDYTNFAIWVYRSNGTTEDLAANDVGTSGSNRYYVHASGRFSLGVEADSYCHWTVTAR